ncbi:MAG: hypothetical protein CMB80_26400 [Flammeovirgaceae bacterium]|nr:hypothetical protein [Flammeovirgaceae bacterium]MBE63168.1 hypothetical protein [Flammeovirgaceae bacterium]
MRYFLILSLIIAGLKGNGQGCSDAGFCTMGAMKPDQPYSKRIDFKLRSLEFNYYHGKSLLSPVITVYTADMNFSINSDYTLQIKVPYQTVKGNLGQTAGVGDLSLSASRGFPLSNGYTAGLTLGAKIATGKSNIENNDTNFGTGGDLPMYYQLSLGSHDLVLGGSLLNEKWLFATGMQMPMVHRNENDFRWSEWADYPSQEGYLLKHALANDLKRGTDVMLRAERNFRYINFNFGIGFLAIYRITKDEIYNFNEDRREKLEGTTGLASNILVNFGYNFNVNHGIKLIGGLKTTDRDVNPDGLTRKHVISSSYVYRF